MILYVMRHGPAEDRSATGRDFDRALTPEGRTIVRRIAEALRDIRRNQGARLGRSAGIPRILASPRIRAQQTAAIVRGTLGPTGSSIEIRDELDGKNSIPLELVTEVTETRIDTMLIGHQPAVEELVRKFDPAPLGFPNFRTAMIVALQSPDETEAVISRLFRIATVLDPEEVAAS